MYMYMYISADPCSARGHKAVGVNCESLTPPYPPRWADQNPALTSPYPPLPALTGPYRLPPPSSRDHSPKLNFLRRQHTKPTSRPFRSSIFCDVNTRTPPPDLSEA